MNNTKNMAKRIMAMMLVLTMMLTTRSHTPPSREGKGVGLPIITTTMKMRAKLRSMA